MHARHLLVLFCLATALVFPAPALAQLRAADGVTLNDEGLAGARIDAESHVIVEVAFADTPARQVTTSTTPSGAYRDDSGVDRFREAGATVSAGPLVITLRGNETLIAALLSKSDWNRLLELLK